MKTIPTAMMVLAIPLMALALWPTVGEGPRQQVNCFDLDGKPACIAHDLQGNFLWASWSKDEIAAGHLVPQQTEDMNDAD